MPRRVRYAAYCKQPDADVAHSSKTAELFKKAPAKQRSFSEKLQQNNGAFQKSSSKTATMQGV
jgi:hypothetical protein